MNNKVFYQHPNLMRVLGMHETVMEVMVNVLGAEKSQVMPELDPWAGTQEATCLQPHGWSPLIQLLFPGRGGGVHSARKEPTGGRCCSVASSQSQSFSLRSSGAFLTSSTGFQLLCVRLCSPTPSQLEFLLVRLGAWCVLGCVSRWLF